MTDLPKRTYVITARIGNCRVCGKEEDLRCDVCFSCSDRVKGEKISAITHRLWVADDPTNEWFYVEEHHGLSAEAFDD